MVDFKFLHLTFALNYLNQSQTKTWNEEKQKTTKHYYHDLRKCHVMHVPKIAKNINKMQLAKEFWFVYI